jgi:redox-sensitive bicupin YhaK (pirin superfamily)
LTNLAPEAEAEICASEAPAAPTLEALPGRFTALGGLPIRRLLPRSRRRLVGAFCFLDAYGPESFSSGRPLDVAPHPHIGLQTVSFLFEGEVLHNDSLGQQALVRPGGLNLMTAGRGIAHAEATPAVNSGSLHGLQLWIALPDAHRSIAPLFDHYPSLPAIEESDGRATIVVGHLAGQRSPARTFSPLVAADLQLTGAAAPFVVPLEPDFEHALMLVAGHAELGGQALAADTLYYLGTGRRELRLRAEGGPTRAFLLGGAPFGETVLMWWNFVARAPEEIAAAREDWQEGRRFGEVVAHSGPPLPAPPLVARPVTGREGPGSGS